MRCISLLSILLFIGTSCVAQGYEQTKLNSIFNGKTWENWKVPDGNEWSIKKGKITAKNNPEKKGSILWTQETYKDFIVQLDFKLIDGNIDSGIFMRGDDKKNPQIQIGISGSLKRDMTGSPYVPGSGYPVEASNVKKLLRLKGWNTIRARAIGNSYTVWLNGEEVMNYTMPNANLEGPVGIQLHPNREMEIQFRKIRLAAL